MLSLAPVLALLKPAPGDLPEPVAFPHPWFRQVGGAAEYAQIRPDALPLPAAWLVRAADSAEHAGQRAENMTIPFDVVIAIENVRGAADGETDETLLAYRREVYRRLEGWFLEPDVRPVTFRGGTVLEYTEGDMYWRDRYELMALWTNYLPDPPAYGGFQHTGDLL